MLFFACFKQLPTRFTLILLQAMPNPGGRLLSDVVGGLIVFFIRQFFRLPRRNIISTVNSLKYLCTG